MKAGKVYLVGAGPGDPGLITCQGLACLEKADVVVYDNLADERLVEKAPASAERIYVGKTAGHHTMPQHRINDEEPERCEQREKRKEEQRLARQLPHRRSPEERRARGENPGSLRVPYYLPVIAAHCFFQASRFMPTAAWS